MSKSCFVDGDPIGFSVTPTVFTASSNGVIPRSPHSSGFCFFTGRVSASSTVGKSRARTSSTPSTSAGPITV
ncbi:hypothetical protein KC19_VG030200 [Ceratodon purpureus]|uniref:Uncharacterized protein n=1 Tax=Ceratodon purpureus TaxID=3225 RepID=A0A8T0HLN4_CERPU|nr:hypothetical protein KC19_VG030200 [Ceratodon purpureus]